MRALTPRIVGEILFHEGLVREAYRDSAGVWTWGVGITDASGHKVGRYRDNPQTIEHCLAVYAWLLRTRYLPVVLAAFGDREPAEHQLAAALSFHWNTGALPRASWLRRYLAGDEAGARRAILDWRRPPEVLGRRKCERDLFFDGAWAGDGTVAVYAVSKPKYCPVRARRVRLGSEIERLFARPESESASPPDDLLGPAAAPEPTWFDRLFD